MSLLTSVQYFCGRNNMPIPSSVIGTGDTNLLQILRLFEEEGNDLALRGMWNVLMVEATLTTTATQSQGAITTLCPASFRYIINDTIWDRTRKQPIYPLDGADWQAINATVSAAPPYRYRLRGGNLLVTPTPSAGLSWYWEYMSRAWIMNGANQVQYFAADTDTMLLPEDLVVMGVRWRYKKEKGLEYAEDFNTYEIQVKQQLAEEQPRKHLTMNPGNSNMPGIYVSAGSWITP